MPKKEPLYPHVKGKGKYEEKGEQVIITPEKSKEIADFFRELRAFLESELKWRKEMQKELERLERRRPV